MPGLAQKTAPDYNLVTDKYFETLGIWQKGIDDAGAIRIFREIYPSIIELLGNPGLRPEQRNELISIGENILNILSTEGEAAVPGPAHVWGPDMDETYNLILQRGGELAAEEFFLVSERENFGQDEIEFVKTIIGMAGENAGDFIYRMLYNLGIFMDSQNYSTAWLTQSLAQDLGEIVNIIGRSTEDERQTAQLVLQQVSFLIGDARFLPEMLAIVGEAASAYEGDIVYEYSGTDFDEIPPLLRFFGDLDLFLTDRRTSPEMMDFIRNAATIMPFQDFVLFLNLPPINQPPAEMWASNFTAGLLEHYSEAERLVRSLGLEYTPKILLNLMYGIAAVGEEKVSALYGMFGIEYFMRYSKETLEELYRNSLPGFDERPLMLVVFNKADYNGAFYSEGMQLEQLTQHYRVVVIETDNEEGFYSAVSRVAADYGPIDTMIIGGHGTPDNIMLGAGGDEGSFLDLTDEQELGRLANCFMVDLTVILASCSTGESEAAVGGMLSRVWGARLFAPREPGGVASYELGEEGQITSVKYKTESSEFSFGIPIRTEPSSR